MGPSDLPVYWEDELVGHLREPSVDMFWLYGRWVPEGTPAAERFLSRLAEAEVQVEVPEFSGRAFALALPQDGMLELKLYPRETAC